MILLFVLQFVYLISVRSKIYEIDRKNSNDFLKTKISFQNKYEQSKEIIETTRESCLDEYRQQQKFYQYRQVLSPFCTQYCRETMDCQQENEQSACINPLYPSWPLRTLKFIQKFQRICYIRITEILQYEQAEQMCRQYGLQLAIIDNIRLLERLKQMNMFNTTCKGQCPKARGYYIGLKRQIDEKSLSSSKWIWSNNVTWTQNQTDCGDEYSNTSFANASLLCYIESTGQKKVTVWNTGEPNNYRHNYFQKDEQCVEIITRSDENGSIEQIGRLNDIPCNKPTLGVICQMNDIKPINSTRFKYFATIIGFNETETEENDLLNNLLSNFQDSIAPNLDAISSITSALEQLLVLPSFTIKQATNILNIVDQLVNITGQIVVNDDSLKIVTNKLLHFLDLFLTKIQINNKQNTSFKYENMNTSLININFHQWDEDKKNNQWFTITSENSNNSLNSIIQLNMRVLQAQVKSTDNYRIIETIFSNFNLFPQMNKTNQLLGIPISYQINNLTMIKTNEDLIRFQIRIPETIQSRNISCVYWSFNENNGSWMTDNGCHFVGYMNNYAQCYCNHLTHFALLMLPESKGIIESLLTIEEFHLTFVTYIGIVLSIFSLVITLITYAFFRCSQKNPLHSSLFMLCLSILFLNCLYIIFSLTKQNLFDNFCNIISFLFHYFFLTSFIWMLIITIIQYMNSIRIFNLYISYFLIKSSFIGWIIPFIFPFLVILIGKNDDNYTGKFQCWINNEILLYITFLIPIFIIILCNLIFFIFTIKNIFQRDSTIYIYKNDRSKLQIYAAFCCFISISCTWLFGIFVLIQPIFIYQFIFCISNSLQGFILFLFHVYLSKPKQKLWQTFFIQRSHLSSSFLTKNDLHRQTGTINPTFIDSNENNLSNKNQIQSGRISNLVLRIQPEFLYDRIQRVKMEKNNSYA